MKRSKITESLKHYILKVVALSFVALASFISTSFSEVRSSRDQSSGTTITQAAPTEKTVEQVFKNIKVLNDMPQSQLYPAMRFMAASLGTQCGFCHVIRNGLLDGPADDKPEKQTARSMIKMVLEINKTIARGDAEVSCYTCHRGRSSPQGFPTLPLPLPTPLPQTPAGAGSSGVADSSSRTSPNTRPNLPSADEILNKHLTAIGGKMTIDRINSLVTKGTSATRNGQSLAYETAQIAPDKGYEAFVTPSGTSERVLNGARGWLKNADGVQELLGQRLEDQKLSFPWMFTILRLKDQYSSMRVSGTDKIDDRDVYVVSAIRLDNKLEHLYFNVEDGLVRRRISYLRTMIGTIPQQTDFEDYRQVQGLKLPFTITVSFVDRGSPILIRKFTDIKLNTPLDESMFDKPSPTKKP